MKVMKLQNLTIYHASYIVSEEVANANAKEGAQLFTYFCSHCHGAKGAGDGKVVTYGEFNPPNPYDGGYKDRTIGQIFHVITYGKGAMGAHGSQLNKDERWKVALHVRTLQHGNLLFDELKQAQAAADSLVVTTDSLSVVMDSTVVIINNNH